MQKVIAIRFLRGAYIVAAAALIGYAINFVNAEIAPEWGALVIPILFAADKWVREQRKHEKVS